MPSVTVLMPVHNGERFIAHAIDSVLAQTFTDFELLIVDDASTDDTAKVIDRYQDHRLRRIVNAQQCGLARTLNIGLKESRGDLIARLDHDDACRPDRLAKQTTFMREQPATALVGSRARLIDHAGRGRGVVLRPLTPLGIRWMHLLENPFIHSSTLFRKRIVLDLGGYAEDVALAEDFELWGRLLAGHDVRNLEEPLVDYRESHGSIMAAATGSDGVTTLRRSIATLIQRHISTTLRGCSTKDALALAGLTAGIDARDLDRYLDLFDRLRQRFEQQWPEAAGCLDYWQVVGRQIDATVYRVRASSRADLIRIAARLRHMRRAIPHVSWMRFVASLLLGRSGRDRVRAAWMSGRNSA